MGKRPSTIGEVTHVLTIQDVLRYNFFLTKIEKKGGRGGYIFIIYICLKQNYIKQYKSLQTNTLFSGYRIL